MNSFTAANKTLVNRRDSSPVPQAKRYHRKQPALLEDVFSIPVCIAHSRQIRFFSVRPNESGWMNS